MILKICDFGTACDKKTIMTNNKGSSAWMAPEVFKGNDYSEKCDVFSWAIILWQCLSRRQPFSKYDNEYAIQWSKVALGKKPPLLKNCPTKLKNLLECCWNQDPAVRLSMNEIVPIMEELYSHCEPATLYPLNLVPTTSKWIIRLLTPLLFMWFLHRCKRSESFHFKCFCKFSAWYKFENFTFLYCLEQLTEQL